MIDHFNGTQYPRLGVDDDDELGNCRRLVELPVSHVPGAIAGRLEI